MCRLECLPRKCETPYGIGVFLSLKENSQIWVEWPWGDTPGYAQFLTKGSTGCKNANFSNFKGGLQASAGATGLYHYTTEPGLLFWKYMYVFFTNYKRCPKTICLNSSAVEVLVGTRRLFRNLYWLWSQEVLKYFTSWVCVNIEALLAILCTTYCQDLGDTDSVKL